jgi:hypothetical protein
MADAALVQIRESRGNAGGNPANSVHIGAAAKNRGGRRRGQSRILACCQERGCAFNRLRTAAQPGARLVQRGASQVRHANHGQIAVDVLANGIDRHDVGMIETAQRGGFVAA